MSVVVLRDLRSKFGPTRDQGQRPTCLAFAASDAHASLRNSWETLSCEFAFFHAQRRAGRSPAQGASLTSMLDALKSDGQPIEGDWPYLDATPVDINAYAPPNGIIVYRRSGEVQPNDFNEIISWLETGRPALVLMMISDAFYMPAPDGVVVAPPYEQPDPLRRHAVIAVGHGQIGQTRTILIRNSWGVDWGVGGYAWLPESFLVPRLTQVATLMESIDVSSTHLAA